MVQILGAGTVVGQTARWDGTQWVPALPRLDLVTELVDPAAAPTLTVSGLNGDADIIYQVYFKILKDATDGDYLLRLNGDAMAANHARALFNYNSLGSGPQSSTGDTSIRMNYTNVDLIGLGNDFMVGYFTLFAKSGVRRRLVGKNIYGPHNPAANPSADDFSGEWKDMTTNLTSLVFLASAGNIGGVGSFIRVYRVLD